MCSFHWSPSTQQFPETLQDVTLLAGLGYPAPSLSPERLCEHIRLRRKSMSPFSTTQGASETELLGGKNGCPRNTQDAPLKTSNASCLSQ